MFTPSNMATNKDEYLQFQEHIQSSMQHYRDIQKKEGDVSPICDSLIRLEGHDVADFSSQYGSESSISYVASNIVGKTCVFPSYGDYTQACVFRTYGPWWKQAPSGGRTYKGTPSDFASTDFIEVIFKKSLYPVRVEIYETYNPGAVIRILACDRAGGTDTDSGKRRWVTLWSGQPDQCKQGPRIFAPHITRLDFATNLIRLELNHQFLDYYTELDGIKLVGTKDRPVSLDKPFFGADVQDPSHLIRNQSSQSSFESPWWQTALDHGSGMDKLNENRTAPENKRVELLIKGIAQLSVDEYEPHLFYLPKEIIQLILQYLNSRDLCRLSQTCRIFYDHCYDPLLYRDLNLQPYWTQITTSIFESLSSRCTRLQHFNLSWVGKAGHIYHDDFISFLSKCPELQTLELSCCFFVNAKCLRNICSTCVNLVGLNLSSCKGIDDFSAFLLYPLPKLRSLNLYRTKIDVSSLIGLFRSSPDLEHLNIASCLMLMSSINQVILFHLGQYCKKLKSIDLWRMKAVDQTGLAFLYNSCPLLEELDIGWCINLKSDTGCFVNLAEKCKNLKKLFLTANRGICNEDLHAVADHCPLMEQLDILGTREVTKEAIIYLLEKCKGMRLLDVSFIVGISAPDVWSWRTTYPNVNIKKSFQNL